MMNNSPSKPIDFILILRGLLACAVVIFHVHIFIFGEIKPITPLTVPWFLIPSGRFTVWCFFLLSGYLMGKGFYSGRYQLTVENIQKFYVNRALRIVPLYTIVCIASLLIHGLYLNPSDIQAHWVQLIVKLITFQYNPLVERFLFNAPLWSIATEVQFYCWVPVWYMILNTGYQHWQQKTKHSFPVWLLVLLIIGLGTILNMGLLQQEIRPLAKQLGAQQLAFETWHAVLYFPLLTNIWIFITGMFINYLPAITALKKPKWLILLLLLLSTVGFLGSSYLYRHGVVQFNWQLFQLYALVSPMFAFPIVWLAVLLNTMGCTVVSLKFPFYRIFKYVINGLESLGKLSYGIYLWHYPIAWLAVHKWMSIDSTLFSGNTLNYWWATTLLSLSLSVILSQITFYLIEHPLEVRKHKTMPLA